MPIWTESSTLIGSCVAVCVLLSHVVADEQHLITDCLHCCGAPPILKAYCGILDWHMPADFNSPSIMGAYCPAESHILPSPRTFAQWPPLMCGAAFLQTLSEFNGKPCV